MANAGEKTSLLGGIDLKAVAWAGIIAGLLFLVLEMLLVPLMGVSPWAPLRTIGAIGLGEGVLPPPATFDIGIALVAALIHFALSILYAFTLAFLVRGRAIGMAVLIGLAFGAGLYLINFYLFTAIFAWFAEGRNWINVVTHLVFGAVASVVYLRAATGERPRVVGQRRYEERPA